MNPPVGSPSQVPAMDVATTGFNFSVESPTIAKSPSLSASRPLSPQPLKINNKARNESRKLLAHVLSQLEHRSLPPPFHDILEYTESQASDRLEVIMETVKDAVRLGNKKRDAKEVNRPSWMVDDDSESDDVEGSVFSTDETYDLMIQLKDVLIMSVTQAWHIFGDSGDGDGIQQHQGISEKPASPFRRSTSGLQPGGNHSRSPSPVYRRQIQEPELLSLCISTLASVIFEDCRYKIASPRPSRPPNALQSLTLDVAQFLLHTHAHDPNVTAKIGFAIIPAFTTFQPEMHSRLLNFFENAILRPMLNNLRQIQGVDGIFPHSDELCSNGDSPQVSISIDTVQENPDTMTHSHWVSWTTSSSQSLRLYSTAAPLQSLSLYCLSSLVPPLLMAILDSVDLVPNSADSDVFHCFRHLVHLILDKKPDAYNDLLQVVAYHTPRARQHAIDVLRTFWPRAIGHIIISRPLQQPLHLKKPGFETPQSTAQSRPHQFTPWRFASESDNVHNGGFSPYDCRSCGKPLHGFGLLCPFCMCGVHFDCFDHPEGSHFVQYALESDPNIRRVAMYRFSGILINGIGTETGTVSIDGHIFRHVNLFTLTLCFLCQRPLWGHTLQGWNCASCMHFVHFGCLSSEKELPLCSSTHHNAEDIIIDWDDLRNSCNDFYGGILELSREDLRARTFEEINILYTAMWIQLQLVTNGLALGSIVVMPKGKDADHAKAHQLEEFELHSFVKRCEAHLLNDDLPLSAALEDYLIENSLERRSHLIMFDWSNLVYICSVIKSLPTSQHVTPSPSDYLTVTQPDFFANHRNVSSQPVEVVSLSYLRDVLRQEFNIQSDLAARIILSYLNQVGLFDRLDYKPLLFNDNDFKTAHAIFPLPLGLDLSADVGMLISTVEVCLSDLDLSVNETGFLLLRRGLWPNGLASEYTLRRLTQSIVVWLLAEDNKLAIVLRDHLTKQTLSPGVRSDHDKDRWLSSPNIWPTSSMTNGGDYIATRRALLNRYAIPWLLSLHAKDSVASVLLIYEACAGMEHAELESTMNNDGTRNEHNDCDSKLRAIVKVAQASALLSIFDELFLSWLNCLSDSGFPEEPIPSLVKLFAREIDSFQSHHQNDNLDQAINSRSDLDPWRVILRIAYEGKEGLSRGLSWLYFLARSAIHIPRATFMRFSALVTRPDSSLNDSILLAKAALCSSWVETTGRQELQTLFSELHGRLAQHIADCLKRKDQVLESESFIRISFGACLLLYGCDRHKIMDLHMINQDDLKGLPSRRKKNSWGSAMVDPMIIDPRLMAAIELYISSNMDDVLCLVAKFLHTFMTDSPYLESYEIDNFILRNGRILAACAWQFYDMQSHEISNLRTSFLLRTLVVDSEPFQDVLRRSLLTTSGWECRLHAVTCLSRVILDVTSPGFNVEDRQWQPSVSEIFYRFFTAMLSDEREEVRLAVYGFSSSLFSTHFDVISVCWNASLTISPIKERIRLISFLVQLHPYFPTWKVLAWDTILEALSDPGVADPFGFGRHAAAAPVSLYSLSPGETGRRSVDSEMSLLRISILQLSLQLMADGVAIDASILLKIKFHLAQAIGFGNVLTMPSPNGYPFLVQLGDFNEIPEIALPCITQFFRVFDARHSVELVPSAMNGQVLQEEKPVSVLVGSAFVDIFLVMFSTIRDFTSIPLLTFKSLLETLCVIIYKHDFESKVLRHLQQPLRRAVSRVLDMLSEDVSYDVRQLALSLVQAFIKRWYTFMGSIIYTAIESAAKLTASLQQYGHDALVMQANAFINMALTMYAQNGLFYNLLKRQLDSDFFVALKHVMDTSQKSKRTISQQSLPELLLRDVLGRLVDSDQAGFQTTLSNLQSYIEVVFHQNYTADLLLYACQHLSYIARRTSEMAPGAVDANPVLLICATLIQHNKPHSRNLVPYIDTILRILLNRTNIAASSLIRLLRITRTLFRHPQPDNPSQVPNNILLLMFEVLGDALKLKSRMLPSTLRSILEAITQFGSIGSLAHLPSLLGLVDPAIHFLRTSIWLEVNSESDFSASLAISRMLLQVARHDLSPIAKLSERSGEKPPHTGLRIRAWNMLAVAAILEPDEDWIAILLEHLPSFSRTYHTGMRVYAKSETIAPEPSAGDINHAFIAIKLWILMAHRMSTVKSTADSQLFCIWNELWPPFEGLVSTFEAEARAGQYLTLWTLVVSSVADLFVFLRTLNTPITVNTSTQLATLNRLRDLGQGETLTAKLIRAIKYMSEAPPEMAFSNLASQVAKDIVAAEKFRVLETRPLQDRRMLERPPHKEMRNDILK